jgi:hypothetical protein
MPPGACRVSQTFYNYIKYSSSVATLVCKPVAGDFYVQVILQRPSYAAVFAAYITLECMKTHLLCSAKLVFCLGALLTSELTWSKGSFEGTFASTGNLQLRLKQLGSRVCGEWSAENESRSSEGLVAGIVKDGLLILTWCADQEGTCSPTSGDPYTQPDRFIAKPRRIERIHGNGDGSNEVFTRVDGLPPKWQNAGPADDPEFLELCKW